MPEYGSFASSIYLFGFRKTFEVPLQDIQILKDLIL